jgi:hypothetical protein
MALVLQGAGYEVREASNALQLKVELQSRYIFSAEGALLVLSADIAGQCATELAALVPARSLARLPRAWFIYTCEFGELRQPPGLGEDHVLGMLEKPFDLDELERMASTCHALFRRSRPE